MITRVKKGTMKLRTTAGMTFLSHFSSLEAAHTARMAGMTVWV